MKTLLFLAVTALFSIGIRSAQASGPAKSPIAAGQKLDQPKYDLGKNIFGGKVALPSRPVADPKAQLERIKPIATKVKGFDQNKLLGMAGRLTEDQLSALEYFTANRKS